MILSVLPLSRDDQGNFHPPRHWAAHGLRLALFAAGCTLSLTAYDALGSALSLLGGEPCTCCMCAVPHCGMARSELSPTASRPLCSHRTGLHLLFAGATHHLLRAAGVAVCLDARPLRSGSPAGFGCWPGGPCHRHEHL